MSRKGIDHCRECDAARGEVACLSAGCVRREALCDGKRDCEDGFDESGCGDADQRAMEQLQVSLHRLSSACGRSFLCFVFGLCLLAGSNTKHMKFLYRKF